MPQTWPKLNALQYSKMKQAQVYVTRQLRLQSITNIYTYTETLIHTHQHSHTSTHTLYSLHPSFVSLNSLLAELINIFNQELVFRCSFPPFLEFNQTFCVIFFSNAFFFFVFFCLCHPQFFIFHVARGPFVEEFYQCVTHGFYTAVWQEQMYATFTLVFTFLLPLCILFGEYRV